ncbi:MAG: hypothetical protein WCO52_03690 [bacterium]
MLILQIIIIILLLPITLGGIFYLVEGTRYQKSDRVVYMGSDLGEQGPILEDVVSRYVKDTEEYELYEPGSGIATVATFLGQRFSWKSIVAVELRTSVYWAGRLRSYLKHRNLPMQWRREDLLSYRPTKPTVVYCYLTGTILDKMYQRGIFRGCLVICLTFEIKGIRPKEIIPLKSWQKEIRVYDFRKD